MFNTINTYFLLGETNTPFSQLVIHNIQGKQITFDKRLTDFLGIDQVLEKAAYSKKIAFRTTYFIVF